MPNWAPLADMPMISTAPRLAEMKARPVTQAGSDRPEGKKSSDSETWVLPRNPIPGEKEVCALRNLGPGQEADAENEDEVDDEDQVVDGLGVDDRRQRDRRGH